MSVEAIAWALAQPLKGTPKLLLIGLANHATKEMDHARPSVKTLSTYASVTPRNVQKGLRDLEAQGWIEKTGVYPVKGRSDRSVSIYRIILERGVASDAPPSQRGVAGDIDGVSLATPEPSIETVHSERAPARQVWDHYQAVIPNGARFTLSPARRAIIDKALEVRNVEECCEAITGLSKSDHHLVGGYLDIRYALRGGKTADPEGTIDRMRQQASRPRQISRQDAEAEARTLRREGGDALREMAAEQGIEL
jgi:hypothetical protein